MGSSSVVEYALAEKKMSKGKTAKVEAPVASPNTADSSNDQIGNMRSQLAQLVMRVDMLDNEVNELKEKKTHAPFAYNSFIKQKMSDWKDCSTMTNSDKMRSAAEMWSKRQHF